MCGNNLAIQIRNVHHIFVNNVDLSDSRAHQGLADIAAHAAHAEHQHLRIMQPLQSLRANQAARTLELIRRFLRHRFLRRRFFVRSLLPRF